MSSTEWPYIDHQKVLDEGDLWCAMIEWDSGTDPEVFLSKTFMFVAREATRSLQACTPEDDEGYFDDPAHPERTADPDIMGVNHLIAWHRDFHEATTIPWVTFSVVKPIVS